MASSRFPDQPDLFADAAEARPSSGRGKLYSIAPHAPFLATLADCILDGTLLAGWPRDGAFWLSDVTIVLPTRRARLALAAEFLKRGVKHARLLPDIRTFAGEDEDEEPFLPPYDGPVPPTPVSPTARRLTLGTLIDAWARSPGGAEVLATPPNAAEILSYAEALGEVIDDLAAAGIPYAALRALAPEDLAESWQKILTFLDIAFEFWPERLRNRGLTERALARNERLRRQAEAAPLLYGQRPVIAAGSTGSIAATADLLRAIADLPRGALVLPGLDTTLTADQHKALLDDARNPHGHPQYGLAKLLRHLNAGPGEVIELASAPAARTAIVRAALSLADDTAFWAEARAELAPGIADASQGLSIIAAQNADEEARAIAICAREALGRGQTVGIVSPDQNLSRRIAAELGRFRIEVDDPAGTPLFQSPAGRLSRIILAVDEGACAPVDLIALLRSPATTFGLDRDALRRMTDRIELKLLRGQRLKPGLAGLREALADNAALPDAIKGKRNGAKLDPDELVLIADLLDRLESVLANFAPRPATAAGLAVAVHNAFIGVTEAGQIPGSDELGKWAGELAAHPGEGPRLPAGGTLDTVLYSLMQGQVVRGAERRRDDIFIWGLLEARLQSPDLIILSGLNEDVWPQPADPGPWLNRQMRLSLGLEPPERRQGQDAHDFEMAIGNGRAVLAFATRLGSAPALPSRYLQRLEALLGADVSREMRDRGRVWLDAARVADAAPVLNRATRPEPRPAAEDRPRVLPITEIETLIRSPYDTYAKHVLKLRKLAPLGEPPDARDRGTIVHDIFARFVLAGHDFSRPDALDILQAYAVEAFSALDSIDERRDIWLHRFGVAARQFLDFERAREGRIEARHAETAASWALPNGFTLTGRADRVDHLTDGTAEVLDFKTGGIPDAAEMTAFLAPQLPLEAAMLEAGAFPGLPPARVSALTYIKVGLGPEAFVLNPFRVAEGSDVVAAGREMARRLQAHVDALLLRDTMPMASRVFPKTEQRQRFAGDYDHLARVDEWKVSEREDTE